MSRFGMCFITAVLMVASVEVAQGQGYDLLDDDDSDLLDDSEDPVQASRLRGLEVSLSEGRWDDARGLIRRTLEPGKFTFNAGKLSPLDTSKPLLPDSDDPMYLALVKDVRAELKTEVLVKKYNEASAEEKDKLQGELTSVVKEHFQVRQKLREMEVERLEKRLEKIRAQIAKRASMADAIVQRRVNQLTGKANDLDWEVGGEKSSRGKASRRYSSGRSSNPTVMPLSPPQAKPRR